VDYPRSGGVEVIDLNGDARNAKVVRRLVRTTAVARQLPFDEIDGCSGTERMPRKPP
jgi:hypothetical protein